MLCAQYIAIFSQVIESSEGKMLPAEVIGFKSGQKVARFNLLSWVPDVKDYCRSLSRCHLPEVPHPVGAYAEIPHFGEWR